MGKKRNALSRFLLGETPEEKEDRLWQKEIDAEERQKEKVERLRQKEEEKRARAQKRGKVKKGKSPLERKYKNEIDELEREMGFHATSLQSGKLKIDSRGNYFVKDNAEHHYHNIWVRAYPGGWERINNIKGASVKTLSELEKKCEYISVEYGEHPGTSFVENQLRSRQAQITPEYSAPPPQVLEEQRWDNMASGMGFSELRSIGARTVPTRLPSHLPHIVSDRMSPEDVIDMINAGNVAKRIINEEHLYQFATPVGYDIKKPPAHLTFPDGNIDVYHKVGDRNRISVISEKDVRSVTTFNNFVNSATGILCSNTDMGRTQVTHEPAPIVPDKHMTPTELLNGLAKERYELLEDKIGMLGAGEKDELEEIAEKISTFYASLKLGNVSGDYDDEAIDINNIEIPTSKKLQNLVPHIELAHETANLFSEVRKHYKEGSFNKAEKLLKELKNKHDYFDEEGQIIDLLKLMNPYLSGLCGHINDGSFRQAGAALKNIKRKQSEQGHYLATLLKLKNWENELYPWVELLHNCNTHISNEEYRSLGNLCDGELSQIINLYRLPKDCALPKYSLVEHLKEISMFGVEFEREDLEEANRHYNILERKGVFLKNKGEIRDDLRTLKEKGVRNADLITAIDDLKTGKLQSSFDKLKQLNKGLFPQNVSDDLRHILKIRDKLISTNKGFRQGVYELPASFEINFFPKSRYLQNSAEGIRRILKNHVDGLAVISTRWATAQKLIVEDDLESARDELKLIENGSGGGEFIKSEIRAVSKTIEGKDYFRSNPRAAYKFFTQAEGTSMHIKRNASAPLAKLLRRKKQSIETLLESEHKPGAVKATDLRRLSKVAPEEFKPYLTTKIKQGEIQTEIQVAILDDNIKVAKDKLRELEHALETSCDDDPTVQDFVLKTQEYITYCEKSYDSERSDEERLKSCNNAIKNFPSYNNPRLHTLKSILEKKTSTARREVDDLSDAEYAWTGKAREDTYAPVDTYPVEKIKEPEPMWMDEAHDALERINHIIGPYKEKLEQYMRRCRKIGENDPITGDLKSLLETYKCEIVTHISNVRTSVTSHQKEKTTKSSQYSTLIKRINRVRNTLDSMGIDTQEVKK